MKIKGAMTILERRAEFYGQTVETLVKMLDNGFDEVSRVLEAYEVYKRHHGYYWSGINGETWVKKENI